MRAGVVEEGPLEAGERFAAPAHDRTSTARLVLGCCSLVWLVGGILGWLVGLDGLRTAGVLGFFALGVGSAPWQLNTRLRIYERLALTFITTCGVLSLGAVAMSELGLWRPTEAFVVVAAVAAPLHILGVRSARETAGRIPVGFLLRFSTDPRTFVARGWPAIIASVVGAVLCVTAAVLCSPVVPGLYGFLPQVGPLWFVGVLLVLMAVAAHAHTEVSRALPVFLLVGVLTLTPAIVYGSPRSQSAAKHIDFVIQIQLTGELNSTVDLYDAYAGFFAAVAWACEVAGVDDLFALAAVWPFALGFMRVIALRYLAGQILPRENQRWVAVTLAVLADSLGADYFSPQSVGFVLGIASIGLALSHTEKLPRLLILAGAGATLAVTHQLSPYLVGGALGVLVLFGRLRPWWAPALILGPALLWALLHWEAVAGFVSFDAFGDPANFRPPKTEGSPQLNRAPAVQQSVVALLLGTAIVGLFGTKTLLENRRDPCYWALACCPAVGVFLVLINPYGQEGVFRALLFGIPWLAMLASPALASNRAGIRLGLLGTSTLLMALHLVSAHALDGLQVIRPADVYAIEAFERASRNEPKELYVLLLLNAGDHPTTPPSGSSNAEVWGRDNIDAPVRQKRAFRPRLEVRDLTERLLRYTDQSPRDANLYALWSPATAAYGTAYAVRTRRQSESLRDALRITPDWKVEFASRGTYLFKFSPSRPVDSQ